MPHESLLIGLSQIGAVFAGFMAVFIALAQRDGRLDPVSALRARSILYTSVTTIAAALLPLVIFAAGLTGDASLKISAGVAALMGLGLSIEGARHQMALTPEQKRATGLVFNIVSWGFSGVAFAVAVAIVFGAIHADYYPLSVFVMLIVSAANFVKISLEQWL